MGGVGSVEEVVVLFCLGFKSLMRIWFQERGGELEIRFCSKLGFFKAYIFIKRVVQLFYQGILFLEGFLEVLVWILVEKIVFFLRIYYYVDFKF